MKNVVSSPDAGQAQAVVVHDHDYCLSSSPERLRQLLHSKKRRLEIANQRLKQARCKSYRLKKMVESLKVVGERCCRRTPHLLEVQSITKS